MKEEITTMSLPLIFIVFLILKLTGVIDWSWWWVTCPIWIPFAMMLVIAALGILFFGMLLLLDIFDEF